MVKIYDSEGDENVNGIFVSLSDYKTLEEKYNELVHHQQQFMASEFNTNPFFDPHD